MASERSSRAAETRRPARDIIDAVVENMHRNREELRYSTIAPNRYIVYLHPAEHTRLEGILPILEEQTCRALADALQSLNQRPSWHRWMDSVRRNRSTETLTASDGWHVEFLVDPDDELQEGEIRVHSELAQPAQPELGVGERTRRITTTHAGTQTTAREQTEGRATEAHGILARLEFSDDAGAHTCDMIKPSLTIGRGGVAYPVDIRIASSTDVSREHARIRRDPASGRFFLTDLSSFGTTLNGRHIPRGYDEVNGGRRENGAETALPDAARIGLADIVFLEFRSRR